MQVVSTTSVATNRGSTLQQKVEAMEPPDKKAKTYQSLSQATIVLSVIFCCWPYNALLLLAIFFLSRMVCKNIDKNSALLQWNFFILCRLFIAMKRKTT